MQLRQQFDANNNPPSMVTVFEPSSGVVLAPVEVEATSNFDLSSLKGPHVNIGFGFDTGGLALMQVPLDVAEHLRGQLENLLQDFAIRQGGKS